MSNAWEGTCGFHGESEPEDGFWPVGEVAFRTTSSELVASAKALLAECQHADPERAEILTEISCWYEDLALDLAEIQALPEYTESPFQALGTILVDPDEDIPF